MHRAHPRMHMFLFAVSSDHFLVTWRRNIFTWSPTLSSRNLRHSLFNTSAVNFSVENRIDTCNTCKLCGRGCDIWNMYVRACHCLHQGAISDRSRFDASMDFKRGYIQWFRYCCVPRKRYCLDIILCVVILLVCEAAQAVTQNAPKTFHRGVTLRVVSTCRAVK